MVGQIIIDCPPMPVLAYDPVTGKAFPKGIRQAQQLDAVGTLFLPGLEIGFNITFPPTWVRKLNLTAWVVDICQAQGRFFGGGEIRLVLPPEPVFCKGYYLQAQAITADGWITLKDRGLGNGTVYFPAVNSYWQGWGKFLVDAVTAEGSVTW